MEIIISNSITIINVDQNLKQILMQQLTLPNPEYTNAVNMGKSVYKIQKYIYNFQSPTDTVLIIPRGMLSQLFDLIKSFNIHHTITDKRTINYIDYKDSFFNLTFRPYQEPAIKALLESTTSNGTLVSMAGSGKTVMGLALVACLQQKTLWLTHTDRLAKQTAARCEQFLGLTGDDIGLIQGESNKVGNVFTIGMVQSLIKKPELLHKLKDEFGMIIIDECLISGTKILLNSGHYKYIEDIIDDDITTFGKVSKKFVRYTDKVVTLRTSSDELSGTPTHRLPIIPYTSLKKGKNNQFEPSNESDVVFSTMNDVNMDDFLLIEENYPHEEIISLGKEKSRLLALIACDGHIDKKGNCLQIGVVKDKDWFLKELWFNTLIYKNHDIRFSDCKRGDLIIRCYSDDAITDMNKFIPVGNKSKKIKVPIEMFNSTYDDIKNYLQVVFDCEGSVTNQITLTMSNSSFVKDIQFLLHKLGIHSRIIPIKKNDGYLRISMSGYDAILFYEKIGFSIQRKQELLKELVNKTRVHRRTVMFRGKVYRCVQVIEKIIEHKTVPVYDFTTEEHLFIANGVLSSNCHHQPSKTFTTLLSCFSAYFIYGLTATAYRRDNLETLLFQNIGPILYEVPKSEILSSGGIILPSVTCKRIKTTQDIDFSTSVDIPYIMRNFIVYNDARNSLIAKDVIAEAKKGHICIVVSTQREHCEVLATYIKPNWPKTAVATGKYSKKKIDAIIEKFENGELSVLITTGHLLGEGFDVVSLDRLFLTVSIRSETLIEQLVGRLQRTTDSKKNAKVYDYIDANIDIFYNQFISKGKCRAKVYNKLGLTLQHI